MNSEILLSLPPQYWAQRYLLPHLELRDLSVSVSQALGLKAVLSHLEVTEVNLPPPLEVTEVNLPPPLEVTEINLPLPLEVTEVNVPLPFRHWD